MPDTDRVVISILIAARNEESTIQACLQAIDQLHFPPAKLEVLIGNDRSTDQTEAIVLAFIADKPHFWLINIIEPVAGLQGKANVLAQLAQKARGQQLVITDADTRVPTDWLLGLTQPFTGKVGIVTGVTLPDGPRLFHKLQALDWLYNLTLVFWVGQFGVPVTAMGNNMAVSKDAYEAVGGYELIPFSVVEDYTLFRAIVAKGYSFRNLLDERVLAKTKPVDTLSDFLQQRKRWMRGAMQLPPAMVVALSANYLIVPLLLLLGWWLPMLAVSLYLIRLCVQTTLLAFGISRLRQPELWPYALFFEVYLLLMGPIALIDYWRSPAVIWKGRTYK